MRENINKFGKRTDFTRTIRPRPMARKAGVDVLSHSKVVFTDSDDDNLPKMFNLDVPSSHKSSIKTHQKPATDYSKRTLKFSLPTFRRPPDSGDLPSRRTLKWVFIGVFALIFFVIGYGL